MDALSGKPIFLAGFMATGKSKVGPVLADRLGRVFLDTDDMVEAAAGKSIPEVFAEDGEPIFRSLEHDCVVRASQMAGAVIALGGGAVTQEANWETIRRTGVSVCLRADAETIFARVTRKGERPLLAGLDDVGRMAKIREMLEAREPFYARADVFVTSTDEQTPEETAGRAVIALSLWAGSRHPSN